MTEEERRAVIAANLEEAADGWAAYIGQCFDGVDPLSPEEWLRQRAANFRGNGVGGW